MTIVPPDADDVGNLADLAPIPEDRGVWSTQLPTWFAEGAGLAADPRAAPSAGSNDNPWAKFNPRAAEERQAAAGAGSRPKKGEPGYKPRGCRAGQGGKWGSREARVSYMRQEEVVRMALDMGRRGLEPCVMPDGTKGWRPKGAGKSVQAANKGAGKGAAAPPAPVPVKAPGHAKGEPAAACAGKGDAPVPVKAMPGRSANVAFKPPPPEVLARLAKVPKKPAPPAHLLAAPTAAPAPDPSAAAAPAAFFPYRDIRLQDPRVQEEWRRQNQ